MSEFEITALVLSEHEGMRRDFAALDDVTGSGLGDAWAALADRLEVHAVAEEQLFYPLLADAGSEGTQETEQGVRDHNALRAAARAVADEQVGSEGWWSAVHAAQEVNAEHMAEEEREFFPDFRTAVPAERREELGLQWLAFHDDHERARGLSGEDADVQAVVEADVPAAPDLG